MRLVAIRAEVLPGSQLAKACNYTLRIWDRLEVFLEHGQVELDTNLAENAMRPVALGRKNWLHIGDEKAGPKIAAIMSVLATCRKDLPSLVSRQPISARCAPPTYPTSQSMSEWP